MNLNFDNLKNYWSALKSLKHEYNYKHNTIKNINELRMESILNIELIVNNFMINLRVYNPILYRLIDDEDMEVRFNLKYYSQKSINLFDTNFIYEIYNSNLLKDILSDQITNSIYNYNNDLKLRHIFISLSEQNIDIICRTGSPVEFKLEPA